MPKVDLTNTGKGPRVVHTAAGGTVLIERGQTRKGIDVSEADLAALSGGPVAAIPCEEAPKPEPSVGTYTVEDKGRGWYVIMKDGEEATKSLRKDDVDGFDELSDADKAAFVEANKADA